MHKIGTICHKTACKSQRLLLLILHDSILGNNFVQTRDSGKRFLRTLTTFCFWAKI